MLKLYYNAPTARIWHCIWTFQFHFEHLLYYFRISDSVILIHLSMVKTYKPGHNISYSTPTCPSEESDQHMYPHKLFTVFAVRLKTLWILSYSKCALRFKAVLLLQFLILCLCVYGFIRDVCVVLICFSSLLVLVSRECSSS